MNSTQLRPLSNVLGAEILGMDARTPDAVMSQIHAAFLKHHLVVLREQTLGDEDIYKFAARFGPIEGPTNFDKKFGDLPLEDVKDANAYGGAGLSAVHSISNLDDNGQPTAKPRVIENYYWHSDKQHTAVPSLLTMLYGIEIPPEGGDTEFADMTKAYAALPEREKARLAGMRVEHSWLRMRETIGDRPPTEDERSRPTVIHPLVRTHPETGEKSLYISVYSSHVLGMGKEEGRKLILELLGYATQPQFVMRHSWHVRDLVFWDNRCLMHRAVSNFEMDKHRRVLRRIIVGGSVPV